MFAIVLKNIKNSITAYKSVYILLIVSQIVAVITLLFTHGIISSYIEERQKLDAEEYQINAFFTDYATYGQLKNCMPKILEKVEKNLDYFYAGGIDGETVISTHSEYHNGKYSLSQTVYEDVKVYSGRFPTPDEYSSSEKIVIRGETGEAGDIFTVAGDKYTVVGVVQNEAVSQIGRECIQISLNSCPDDVALIAVVLSFKRLPKQSDYVAFRDGLKSEFGDAVQVDDFEAKDEEELIAIYSVIVLSVVIGVIAALDTALLYGYVIKKRKKQMAVLGIIGAKRSHRVLINEFEILIVSLAATATGFIIFKIGLEKLLVSVYKSDLELYNAESYALMLTVYMFSILVITFVLAFNSTRGGILETRRKANG